MYIVKHWCVQTSGHDGRWEISIVQEIVKVHSSLIYI